jgi:hypothetical protein
MAVRYAARLRGWRLGFSDWGCGFSAFALSAAAGGTGAVMGRNLNSMLSRSHLRIRTLAS